MRSDEESPAENTCRIVKGLDAVWAYFCPSKPCMPLSTDGNLLPDTAVRHAFAGFSVLSADAFYAKLNLKPPLVIA